MVKRVLFVEDDDVIRENYTELLTDEGFTVEAFPDRFSALARAEASLPDIALLDIALEDEPDGGFQLCADLRRLSAKLPIIFLTSHDSEPDMISGLRLGADDYIVKDPDKLRYLVIRIETLLRRITTLTAAPGGDSTGHRKVLIVGPLTLDQDKLLAYWNEQRLDLTLTQLWILHELVSHPGQLKTAEKLMAAAKITVEPNTITAHIKHIRDRFKSVDNSFDCIRSEWGKGYRWIEPVEPRPNSAATSL